MATRATTAQRSVPERVPELSHLDLEELRAYRGALNEEETRVSYWRRIIQARLDLLRAHTADGGKLAQLTQTFTKAEVGRRRVALITVVPADDVPPIPDLEELWARTIDDPTDLDHDLLDRELSFAELQLSSYRQALHRRIGQATDELVARYREDPQACLIALPLEPRQVARTA